jgi:hypothetical protein
MRRVDTGELHTPLGDMMIVPDTANMPPTPWQTEILAPGIWAGAVPRIWRTLSCSAVLRSAMKARLRRAAQSRDLLGPRSADGRRRRRSSGGRCRRG